jgi:hypothetical protein
MGQNQGHALGRNRRDFIKKESTPFTFETLADANALKLLNFSLNLAHERGDREDWRPQRSIMERITRRKVGSWSLEAYMLPSGTAGTAPDLGAVLEVAFGIAPTVVGGTSVTYNLTPNQNMGTFSAHQGFPIASGQAYGKTARGCWAESLGISINGTDAPRITAEGGCADVAHSGFGTSSATSSGTTITLQSGEGAYFQPGSFIIVQGGDIRSVVSIAGDVLTVNSATAVSTGHWVAAWQGVTPVTVGAPLGGITGGITIGGDTVSAVSMDINLANNHKAIDDEALASTVEDYIPGFRSVTGTIAVRARGDYLKYMLRRQAFAPVAVNVTVGNVAGSRIKFNMAAVEIEYGEDQVPGDAEVTLQLPFKALGSSAGDNELVIAFD